MRIFQSETYSILDCVYYNPNDLTSETQLNKYFGSDDFCVEWDLKATSRTASYSYIRVGGTDYNNCIQIGHLYSTGGAFIRVIQNGNQVVSSQGYTVPLDTDIHCKYTRNGNTHTLEIGDATLTLTDSTYTDLTLLQAVVTDETEDMRNLKVYRI